MPNQDYNKELTDLTKKINELKSANIELEKSLMLLNETTKKVAKADADLAAKTKANTDAVEKLTAAQKAEAEIKRLATKEGKEELKLKTKLAIERKKATDNIKEEITGSKAAAKAQKDFNKAHSEAIAINKKLNTEQRKLNEAHAKAIHINNSGVIEQKKLNKAHAEAIRMNKQYDKAQAQSNKTVKKSGGLFKSMTKSIIAAGAAMLTIRAAFNVFKNGISTIAKFGQGMSKVRAVTNAVQTEFKALSANAKFLGQTTSKSALQVAGLQLEFSKLGFSTKEILAATEATISLSIAAGSDLANSAVVAASTVRGFGLSAQDTQKVVDVMAKSFASSSLDLEKFKTAMGVAAPIAKAFGKDIEFTTSRLSVLTDAGIDASTAGTSLRNIFLELSKSGLTWEEGLQKINSSTNKNATALQLFGKRGATAALVLADNIDKAEGLEKAYRDSAGAAKRMATIMEDNLIGDTVKLSSVWEGLILTLTSGGNKFTKFLRGAVQGVTNLISSFQKLVEASPVKEIEAEREEVIKLTGAIQNANLSEEDRILALDKLKLLAPEVAKGVDLEAESYGRLNDQLDAYLDKAVQRIAIASLEEKEQKALAKAARQRVKQNNALARAFDVLVTVSDEYRVREGDRQEQLKETIKILDSVVEAQLASGEAVVSADVARTKEQEQLGALRLAYNNIIAAKEKENKITEKSVTPLSQRIALLKDEFGLTEEANEEIKEGITDVTNKTIEAAEKRTKVVLENVLVRKDAEALTVTDEAELQDALSGQWEEYYQKKRELREVDTEEEKISAEDKKRITQELISFVGNATNELFSLKNSIAESEIANVERQRDFEVSAAEEAGEDTSKIQKKYAKKEAELRTKQAQREKRQKIFTANINIASGIVTALGSVAPPANFILAALVGALGAVQLATIKATPLPKFEQGTNGQLRVATDAIVSEKGQELVKLKTGEEFLTPKTQTVMHLPSGSEVFSHKSPETQAAMAGGMSEEHYKGLVASNDRVVKAIENQPRISSVPGYNIERTKNNRQKVRSVTGL